MQKAYFRQDYYLFVAKIHPTKKDIFFLFAKSIDGKPDFFLGKWINNRIEEATNFRQMPWGVQKGAERLFALLDNRNLPSVGNVLKYDMLHTHMTQKQHSTIPKPERNKEIVIKRLSDPETNSLRKLGAIYNIHWTTVASIIDRYKDKYYDEVRR